MLLDLTDTTFASQAVVDSVAKIDLTGTLLKFKDGSKVAAVDRATETLAIEVDNDALADKYQFVTDHAP